MDEVNFESSFSALVLESICMLALCSPVLCAVLLGQVDPIVQPWVDARFARHTWRTPPELGSRQFGYRLYVPPSLSPDERRPLLVWLHGEGEAGYDNFSHLRWLELLFEATQDAPDMFVVAMQHAPSRDGWGRADDAERMGPLSIVMQIVDQLQNDHPIDAERIYLAGVSSGGTACWQLASMHPTRFAAMAPMASNGADASQAAALTALPIWAFHSSADRNPTPDGARQTVAAVVQAGGNAWFTETEPHPIDPHNCWVAAFRDHRWVDWAKRQQLGQPAQMVRSGQQPWPWWQVPAWVAGLMLLGLAVWWDEKRRNARRAASRQEATVMATQTETSIAEVTDG